MGGGASAGLTAATTAASERELTSMFASIPFDARKRLLAAMLSCNDDSGAAIINPASALVSAKVTSQQVPHTLGKAAVGKTHSHYADQAGTVTADMVQRSKAKNEGLAAKKRVLMVIDVQDGYDAGFIASLPDDVPGGLSFILRPHDVHASYELDRKIEIEQYAPGAKLITYDKGWNRGLDAVAFASVTSRVVQEIESKGYDAIVFTYDYLEKSCGEERGIFPLDDTPWSDAKKPIALVPYASYLTLNAGGLGTDISRHIRKALPEVTNARGPVGKVCDTKALYFRKQVDDAFDERRERSERTRGQDWLDDVDVDDNGMPQPNAQRLLDKLCDHRLGPDEATLCYVGVVTNRCVASSLLHAVKHGYETVLIEGGCCASDDVQHAQGVQLIRDKGREAVAVEP